MKVARVVVLLGLVAFACAQLNAGQAWEGTWDDGKRGFGGSLFICVDVHTATAAGAYSDAGLISGSLQGDTFKGFWYEAGYDTPYGPFELTISGTSFSGFWSYAGSNETISWTGSRSSGARPANNECLNPITAGSVDGTYTDAAICYHPDLTFENTDQQFVSGFFSTFGIVQGFTFDSGVSVALSDFTFPDDEDESPARYRPENQADFGPSCTSEECLDDDADDDTEGDDDDSVNTRRIVVGRLVDQNTFCGGFWEGFYNRFIGNVCFTRTNPAQPDTFLCGSDVVYINGHGDIFDAFDGKTTEILDIVQDAFDNLVLPPIVIIDDDSNDVYTNTYTTISSDETSGGSSFDEEESSSSNDAARIAASAMLVVVALALF